MKDESYLFCPLLEDGDSSNLVHVQRSLMEKLWGILSQSPAASWLNFPSDIKYGTTHFQEKSTKEKATMTLASGSPIRSVPVLILILILIIFLLAILSFSLFIWSLGKQQSPSVPHPNVAVAKNLSIATLLEARDQEPPQGAMRDCLDKAVQEFSTEPSLVMKNTRMILHCNGTKQEFVSGNGGTHIEVVWINDMARYSVNEANAEVHVARLARNPLPLSLTSINEVLRDLASWNGSEEMQECLRLTLQKFCEEPTTVQHNAKVVVSCGNHNMTFISGKAQNEISVYRGSAYEEIQYKMKATFWARFVKFWKGQWK